MEPGIAEALTNTIRQAYISNNTLQVTEKNAQALLGVTITGYKNEPFSYDAGGTVKEYRVTITASAVFSDEKKSKSIWQENNITCQGIYTTSENEETGKQRAIKELASILIENTISGW